MRLSPTTPSKDSSAMDHHVLQRTAEQLATQHKGVFSPEMIERYLFESYAALRRTAKVHTYLAATAGQFANSRLRALAQSMGYLERDRPQVLFVCVTNAGRSQLAAALLTRVAGDGVEVRSAGSLPAPEIPTATLQLLQGIGSDLSKTYPKPLTDDVVRAADFIITMGCGDTCPIYPEKTYLDWKLEDPQGQSEEFMDQLVSDLENRVNQLWATIKKQPENSLGR